MTKSQLKRPAVGDTGWVVEWCVKRGRYDDSDPESDYDRDGDVTKSRIVGTREEAEALAREKYPLDQYGAVAYWPVEFVAYDEADAEQFPHAGFWEDAADGEFYEGEG